ncbi:MAG: methyltransferase domain-containing protein [Arenicellales bacterium]
MSHSRTDSGEFLDSEQYSEPSIRAYEAVYGRDFVSPGGETMARELISRLRLKSGARVLDAGCGLGGSAFLMAREFGARVDAVDLSHNMITMAQSRRDELGLNDLVRLEHGDCLDLQRHDYYDAVYSRDVFLHIHDKAELFEVLLGALRPGGRLLFTDYCCGDKPWSEEFSHYLKMRAYSLLTLPQYVALLETAGFTDVCGRDLTSRFRAILDMELSRIRGTNMDDRMRAKLEAGWEAKLRRAEAGDQRWGLLEGRRP